MFEDTILTEDVKIIFFFLGKCAHKLNRSYQITIN